jgi:hypothetical protein
MNWRRRKPLASPKFQITSSRIPPEKVTPGKLQKISEDDSFVAKALKGQLEGMRQAAGGSTPLEKLLAEHRIAAWLFYRRAEQRLTAEPESRRLQRAARAARRRLESAERRLATVRRLLRRGRGPAARAIEATVKADGPADRSG